MVIAGIDTAYAQTDIQPIAQSESQDQQEDTPELNLSDKLSKKISLDLRNMDIIDTIKFLAVQGDLNIVTSKSVSGRITLFLNDVTIGDILDVILRAQKENVVVHPKFVYPLLHIWQLRAFTNK